MKKTELLKLKTLIKIIECDISIHEELVEEYKQKAKESLYYYGLSNEKEDRIKYLKSYLKMLKDLIKGDEE